MRPGLTTPLWRHLSRSAPCHCASSCYGTMWRTLKSRDHQFLLQRLNSSLFLLPCCSTILHQSRLLHTTPFTYKTRRFFFEANPTDTPCNNLAAKPMETPHKNLRRPQNVRASIGSDDGISDDILERIKQATSSLKKDEALHQLKTPTAPVTPNLNTSLASTFAHQKLSVSPIESESAVLSAFIKNENQIFSSSAPNFSVFNVKGKDQNKDSSYRSKTEAANYFSSEQQVLNEHLSVDYKSKVDMSRSFFEKDDRAPENRSSNFSGVENNTHYQPRVNKSDCDGEMSTDRQRFRRGYSRNRSYTNSTALSDLPANMMTRIKEASHLLRHGTIFEQSNTPVREKYFVQERSTEETTLAVEPDASSETSLRRHQSSRAIEKPQMSDSLPKSIILDRSSEGSVKMDSLHSASFIKDASSAITEELLETTRSLESLFSTISKQPTKILPPSLDLTGESHATVPAASSTRPLLRSVPLLTPYARQMPRTSAEQLQLMKAPIVSPPNSRLLRVALLGLPNSGKSTLVNALLEDRVCSVSNKANSTRCLARAIYTTEDTQLVFLDTPGIVTPEQKIKHSLFGSVVQDAERSLAHADLLLLLHDCSSPFNRLGLHPRLLRVLALHPHIPAMLVMNKVDLVKPKQQLLKMTRLLTDGLVGGRRSHGATPSSKHRDPFRDLLQDPDTLVKRFLDSLEQTSPEDGGVEQELQTEEDEWLVSNAQVEATQQTQQVSFVRLMSGKGPVVLPCSDGRSKFHATARVSDEDVLSGRVKLSEQQLAAFIEGRRGWPYFERVLLTSALAGDGVMDLRQVLEDSALPGLWQYPANMVTDQDPYQLATLTVREKFMDKFRYQLPYNLRFEVDNWELSDADSLTIRVRVICQEAGLVKYLVGSNGCHIKTLNKQAEQKLGQIFKADVRLQLIVSSEDEIPRQADDPRRKKMKTRDQS